MKILLNGYRVNNEINYRIVDIKRCCDKIIDSPVIDLQNDFEDAPAVAIVEHSCSFCWEDHFENWCYHKISYCPFCGEKITIEVVEVEEVTEQYAKTEKTANDYYAKANQSDSRKQEEFYRTKGHEISKRLEWWSQTDSLKNIQIKN